MPWAQIQRRAILSLCLCIDLHVAFKDTSDFGSTSQVHVEALIKTTVYAKVPPKNWPFLSWGLILWRRILCLTTRPDCMCLTLTVTAQSSCGCLPTAPNLAYVVATTDCFHNIVLLFIAQIWKIWAILQPSLWGHFSFSLTLYCESGEILSLLKIHSSIACLEYLEAPYVSHALEDGVRSHKSG